MLSNRHIIIDFKAFSPKEGDLFGGRNPVETAIRLESAGVSSLSVVTAKEFDGSLELLKSITSAVKLPVLRKDFIKTEQDLYETLECGAKQVLLVCAVTEGNTLTKLHKKALDLGLTPVVEVHTATEAEFAKEIDAKVILINNKDITVLEKDNGTVETTISLIKHIPKEAYIISASGIQSHQHAQKAIDAGANAVLIGTAFWKDKFRLLD